MSSSASPPHKRKPRKGVRREVRRVTITINARDVRELVKDATVLAAAVRLYVPSTMELAHLTAARVWRKYGPPEVK